MPIAAAIVPAVIGAGTAAYSASQQKKAASKANAAQQQAAEQQLQLQREQFDRVQGINQPFINGGYAAFDQLLSRLGVSGGGQPQRQPAMQPQTRPSAQPQTAPGGQRYQTRGMGGQQAPAGYYFGPSDELLPIPGGQAASGQPGPYGAAPSTAGAAFSGGGGQDALAGGSGADMLGGLPQGGGEPDWAAYRQQNPDVAENARQRAAAEGISEDEVSRQHWEAYGKNENRALPMQPSQMASDPNAPPDYMNMARPDAPEAPTFQRPQDMQFENYGTGPQVSEFIDPSKFQVDPGYQFRLSEGLNSVNAASAARGKLRSGDAAKALQQRGEGLANQGYNDWYQRQLQAFNASRGTFQDNRNYGTGLTQYRQGRQDNIFADDRGYDTARWQDARTYGDARFDAERNYATDRYDNQTNNLFRVTGIGTGAAGAVSGAGSAYANNAGNIFGNQADAASQAAQQRASANAGMVGAIGGAVGNAFSNWGGGARPTGGGGATVPITPFDPNYRSWAGGTW